MYLRELPALLARTRDVSPGYIAQLTYTAAVFDRFCGRPCEASDLTDDLANSFLLWLRDKGRKPRTIRNARANLLTLWKLAHPAHAPRKPEAVRTVRVAEPLPQALLQGEIRALLAEIAKVKGHWRNGVDKQLWALALIHSCYDTGLRLGDLIGLEIQDIWRAGSYLSLIQSKTRQPHTVPFRPETLALIDRLVGERRTGRIWLCWAKRGAFFRFFRLLRRKAGLPVSVFKGLRRSSASYLEAERPGYGARHLGHRTPGMAERYYFDRRIVARDCPLPPPLS